MKLKGYGKYTEKGENSMVTELWGIIAEVVTGFITSIVSAFSGLTAVFYTEGVDGGFTVIGQLLLIGLGMGIIYFAFRFITNLVRK